ncbi:hypothetical protein NL676_002063 [Syzygium grande]|nr:hypothetical protein NL676_002063 [Syzygium grande]
MTFGVSSKMSQKLSDILPQYNNGVPRGLEFPFFHGHCFNSLKFPSIDTIWFGSLESPFPWILLPQLKVPFNRHGVP